MIIHHDYCLSQVAHNGQMYRCSLPVHLMGRHGSIAPGQFISWDDADAKNKAFGMPVCQSISHGRYDGLRCELPIDHAGAHRATGVRLTRFWDDVGSW